VTTEWFCLPAQTYSLLNDPWTQPLAYNIALTVDYCNNVANKLGQDNSTCVSD